MYNIANLAVFSALKNDIVISSLSKCFDSTLMPEAKSELYCNAIAKIYECGMCSPGEYILSRAITCDNTYMRKLARGEKPDAALEYNFAAEAELIGKLADISYADYRKAINVSGYIPIFEDTKVDIPTELKNRAKNINIFGFGIFADNVMFELDESCNIVPVRNPDDTKLCDLIHYDREHKIIYDNTAALIEGKPAANILLTGDAGTGKSSTVKAVVNELAPRGLRIIQIGKEQLHYLKKLLAELSENPLKFIIFIDDLSFRHDDDNSRALKAVLEGSVSAKSSNVAIYATSNRRHIIRESLKEREGDEVHRGDAMQETISLSERFGIRVSFSRPDKATYLGIAEGLARAAGLEFEPEALYAAAERFALERGLRSPRAAKQLVDAIASGHIKL